MATYIYSHNARRGLVRQLARRLHIRCVDATIAPKPRDVRLICWGNSTTPNWRTPFRWIANTPEVVAVMSHKIRTFRALDLQRVPCLEWTEDRDRAARWLEEDRSVYVRNVLQGHSGEGLQFIQWPENTQRPIVPQAPLYTRNYGTPFKEYRVHVVNGRVIDKTMKQRMGEEALREHGIDGVDERTRLQVRTYGNGWVFARGELPRFSHDNIDRLAIDAIAAVGATFGAVDIVAKWRNGTLLDCKVVEINSAPALRSTTTLNAYVQAFANM